ncbi:MAG TPA: 50S ribosomal protein L29 [Gemmatimonadaceae bacterium]|nr:50S ribosomal protein L29 [Gemmatimonadaceae bacterium]
MKALKASELRELPVGDLRARIAELEEERFRLGFRSATEALDEPLRLRTIRKDIARLHTVLNEKKDKGQVAQGKSAEGAK